MSALPNTVQLCIVLKVEGGLQINCKTEKQASAELLYTAVKIEMTVSGLKHGLVKNSSELQSLMI